MCLTKPLSLIPWLSLTRAFDEGNPVSENNVFDVLNCFEESPFCPDLACRPPLTISRFLTRIMKGQLYISHIYRFVNIYMDIFIIFVLYPRQEPPFNVVPLTRTTVT